MKITILHIAFFLVFCFASTAMAQDTCKKYMVPNPHGAAMTVYKVWILDSVNFTVASVKPLPYNVDANGTSDFNVCILPRDGKTRSTQVRYENTHGTSSYAVTMTPPGTASVKTINEAAMLHVFPNPANNETVVDLGKPILSSIVVEAVNVIGERITVPTVMTENRIKLDLKHVPSGTYTLILTDGSGILGSSGIVVQH